jgi:tyrosyl-tRNA synthetase
MNSAKPTLAPVNEQMDLLKRGAEEIISEEDLQRKLERSYKTGEPLIVKQGFDPSAPDLHIGHAVSIRKLRQFQQLGHRVIFLIGDFTGMVGDPSGRSKTRPRLTKEDVAQNAETYKQQVFKILDAQSTEIRFNSEWHQKHSIYSFLDLTSRYTVARMLERDDFQNRYRAGEAISMLEFLYPLLQAYDSVALKADVELGGMDQKFNLLLGRKIQGEFEVEEQVAFMLPLLVGTDGTQKMSKSLNNYIGVTDQPEEMYGRIMSIPDNLIVSYFTLTTDVPSSEIQKIQKELTAETTNPMFHKQRLAREIIALYHSQDAAASAENDFLTRFRHKEIPDGIPEVSVNLNATNIPIIDLLIESGAVTSKGEGRRLIQGGAVKIDQKRIDDFRQTIDLKAPIVLQIGKRKIYRINPRIEDE